MKPRGFTLLELVVVSGLMGTVVALAFGLIWNQASVSREAALSAQELKLALQICETIRNDARLARTVKANPDGTIDMTFNTNDPAHYKISDERLVRVSAAGELSGPRVKKLGFELNPAAATPLLRLRILCGASESSGRLLVLDCVLESLVRDSK